MDQRIGLSALESGWSLGLAFATASIVRRTRVIICKEPIEKTVIFRVQKTGLSTDSGLAVQADALRAMGFVDSQVPKAEPESSGHAQKCHLWD
jgi:hypothetical protein